MTQSILVGIAFFAVFGGAIYGVYKLMQHNGDIKDLKSDVSKLKGKL